MGSGRWGLVKTHLFPYIWDLVFGALPILYIGFKVREMDKFMAGRKNLTITVFDKPISKIYSANTRSENMVSSHPENLAMKYRFEKFVVKSLCQKDF